ncbi:bifunctional helix-turn-helix transcriptional regulator/GNAT family N-acetyltransferase [Frateuria sp. YIM B11624]|uniref:bifunctional helix-turn-helix transcriptional regulator/GNAT family N-acetyltransferase n=1 Tax=Frateuria sp. YIM B11624 TaxID=3143185 RepID=UPI003C760D29
MDSDVRDEQIAALRSFNRFYTQRIGALDKGLLDSAFSLTQARVLFELARRQPATASQIGAALELDRGYLSRIVQGFVEQGLIARNRSSEDARQVTLHLTAAGRRAFRGLDGRSQRQSKALLSGLPAATRGDLLTSLRRVQHALAPSHDRRAASLTVRTHRPGDIGWAIERHGHLYAEEYGWDGSFEALVASLFAAFAMRHDPAMERLWIAELDGERAGCVFVVRNAEEPELAQLRCLLVDPIARGAGVGRRLVGECVGFARAAGYRGMTLWTNDVLAAARHLYQEAGFRLVHEYAHHSFGHDLVGQVWRLDF